MAKVQALIYQASLINLEYRSMVQRPLTPPRALTGNSGEREPDRGGDALIQFIFLLYFQTLEY